MENPAQTLPLHTSVGELSERFSHFFESKIANLRTLNDKQAENRENQESISSEPSLCMAEGSKPSCSLEKFGKASQAYVLKIIKSNKIKTCSLDPVPACVLRRCLDILLPALTDMINQSLQTGTFPSSLKSALIIPTLKSSSLDPETLRNYRPISNLPFLGKVIERIVIQQLMSYLNSNSLLPSRQSAYRQHHSVETALIRVQNDLLQSLDTGNEAVLLLLDLTSAFDTVDHSILLKRLRDRFGVTGVALDWFASYLSGRHQSVMIKDVTSTPKPLLWGVPQGSVIGPLLFICYTAPVEDIILSHGFSTIMYADDTQLYVAMKPQARDQVVTKLELCLQDIRCWMKDNQLVLNDDKMEVLHVSSRFKQCQELGPITSGSSQVGPSPSLRDLGVILDSHLTMQQHVNITCKKASLALRRIGSVRQYLNRKTTEILVHAFVTSLLDGCNCLLLGVLEREVCKLQRIQNSAARLVSRVKRSEHITPVLKDLHWLPVKFRIQYKAILTVFKALHGMCPEYISELLIPYVPPRSLRSSTQHLLTLNPGATKTYGDRAFASGGPKLWNALPVSLRSMTDVEAFKRELKTHLFNKCFL